MMTNTSSSYGSVSKLLHWLVFILVLGMIIFGYFLDDIPKEYKSLAYTTHKLTGLLILALMLFRVLWMFAYPKPALPADIPAWQKVISRCVQILLYVTVIAMPLAGLIGSVAAGRPPRLGDIAFVLPISPSKPLAESAFDVHGALAIAIIVLVSLHALAALYHHFIRKDTVLKRMLPGS